MATLVNHSRTRQRMLSRYASFSHFAIKLFFAVPLKNCHSSRLHGGSQAPLSPPPVLACGFRYAAVAESPFTAWQRSPGRFAVSGLSHGLQGSLVRALIRLET